MTLLDEIKEILERDIEGAQAIIRDPREDGMHLEALVIAEQFDGMPLIKQHQMVMNAVKDYFSTSLHALAVKTFTPKIWEEKKREYASDI